MSDQPLSEDNNQASYGTNAGGPGGAPVPQASRKMQATKAQVDEVVDIMRSNVEQVLERDTKICMMDDRADALHQGASQFETQAAKLKNKFWLENMKYMIALGIVVVIVIAVAVYKYKDTATEMYNSISPGTGGESVPGGDMNIPNTVSPLEMMSMGPENSNRLQPINQDYIQAQPEVPAQEPSSPQTEDLTAENTDPSQPENAEAG